MRIITKFTMEILDLPLFLIRQYSRPILRYPAEYKRYVRLREKEWPELKQALSGPNADDIVVPLVAFLNAVDSLQETLYERTRITSEYLPDFVLKIAELDRNAVVVGVKLEIRDMHYSTLTELLSTV